jgi:hypothetical protein
MYFFKRSISGRDAADLNVEYAFDEPERTGGKAVPRLAVDADSSLFDHETPIAVDWVRQPNSNGAVIAFSAAAATLKIRSTVDFSSPAAARMASESDDSAARRVEIAITVTAPAYRMTDGVTEDAAEATPTDAAAATALITFHTWTQSGGIYLEAGGQSATAYNEYTPKSGSQHTLVGCTAIATAQLIYYWGSWQVANNYNITIDSIVFDESDTYISSSLAINIDNDAAARGFLSFPALTAKLSDLEYDFDPDEIAALCFGVGVKVQADYGLDGTSASYNVDFMKQIGFTNAKVVYELDYDGLMTSTQLNLSQTLIANMTAGTPVLISMYDAYMGGHAIIIDGYDSASGTFHFNMGWGGSSDGWYSLSSLPAGFDYIRGIVYDLALTNYAADLVFDGALSVLPSTMAFGTSFTVSGTLKNNGNAASQDCVLYIYASTDGTISAADTKIGEISVGAIAAGGSQSFSCTISSTNLNPGSSYIGVIADAGETVREGNAGGEDNNVSGAVLITVTGTPTYPDLVFDGVLSVSATTVAIGGELTVSGALKNNGAIEAGATVLYLYASADGTITAADRKIGEIAIDAIAAGGSRSFSGTITIEDLDPGIYYLGGIADAGKALNEGAGGEDNNISGTIQITVSEPLFTPDLVFVGALTLTPNDITIGDLLTISGTIKNAGGADAKASVLYIYGSDNDVISDTDIKLAEISIAAIKAGASQNFSCTISTGGLPAGIYYIGAVADVGKTVYEGKTGGENNNTSSAALLVVAEPPDYPDLVFQGALTLSGYALTVGDSLTVSGKIRNSGELDAGASVLYIYASYDGVITPWDTKIGEIHLDAIASGGSRSFSCTVSTAGLTAGSYYIGALVDAEDQVAENSAGESNNASGAILITLAEAPRYPDLVFEGEVALSQTTLITGETITITGTIKNNGTDAAGSSTLYLYRSTDASINAVDTKIAEIAIAALGVGESQSFSKTVSTAGFAPGSYYIGGIIDANKSINEGKSGGENNNTSNAVAITVTAVPQSADLVFDGVVTIADTSLTTGENITISGTVKNNGTAAAGASVLYIYRSENATITAEDEKIGEIAIAALGVGASRSFSKLIFISAENWSGGTYYIGGILNADQAIAEEIPGSIANNTSNAIAITVVVDDVPPAAPVLTVDVTTPTPGYVTITAQFAADSAANEYSLDNTVWQKYSSGVVVTDNGTVYFRSTDKSGNRSTSSHTVDNILSYIPEGGILRAGSTGKGRIGVLTNYTDTFTLSLDYAGKYALAGSFGVLKGKIAIMSGTKTVASGTISNGVLVFNKNQPALLAGGDYTVVIQNTDKGLSRSYYYFTVNADTLFDRGNNADDNWAALGDDYKVAVGDAPVELFAGEWAGYGDAVDYREVTFDYAGKYTFAITSGDAAKLTVYTLLPTGKLKALKTVAVKAGAESAISDLLLTAGTYYLGVQSTNAARGGSADYTVALGETSVFYTKGNNADDNWAALGDDYKVAVGDVPVELFTDEWAGYGDAVDYRQITFDYAGKYTFAITSGDAAKLTVYTLLPTGKLKALKTVAVKAGAESAISDLLLTAGTYYLGVQSTNAAKGGSADYTVALGETSVFYTKGDNADDTFDTARALASGEAVEDWVGFGDKLDYRSFTLAAAERCDFSLTELTDNMKVTFYTLLPTGKLKSVKSFSSKTGTAELAGAVELAAGNYYVALESTTAAKGGGTDYRLEVNFSADLADAFADAASPALDLAAALDAVDGGASAELTGATGFDNAFALDTGVATLLDAAATATTVTLFRDEKNSIFGGGILA